MRYMLKLIKAPTSFLGAVGNIAERCLVVDWQFVYFSKKVAELDVFFDLVADCPIIAAHESFDGKSANRVKLSRKQQRNNGAAE